METRMQKWKKYRDEINNNISLQHAVLQANEKLKILTNRLFKAYPSYKNKYKMDLFEFKAVVDEIPSAPKFPKDRIEKIFDLININENLSISPFEITKEDFSDKELEYIIKEIKESGYDNENLDKENSDDILLSKTRFVSLPKDKEGVEDHE